MSTNGPGHIEAVIVNHNTSMYVELALQSLYARHGSDLDLSITVMDNDSLDDMAGLRAFAAARSIPICPSGFDRKTVVNSHGEVLADFVLGHPDCGYYLFLDADICFLEDDTISTMRDELDAVPDAWAIQARATWNGRRGCLTDDGFHTAPQGGQLDLHWTWAFPGTPPEQLPGMMRTGRWLMRERCHPFCTLIRNTPVFRRVVEHIGLSEAWFWDNRNRRGGFYDTLALASHVMRTHQQRWICSSKLVHHFFNVSYEQQGKQNKDRQCQEWLQQLRPSADFAE